MTKSIDGINWERMQSGEIIRNSNNVEKIKPLLDSVGCGFCLAKFTQVTMHLGTGLVHSCHHPKTHKIPLDELKNNPAALFNTSTLKAARKQMLNGEKPDECGYCWRIEKNGNTSDRHLKSIEPWALDKFDQIVSQDPETDIKPTYLEVSFGNTCNLSCVYCGPEFSSKWVDSLKNKGPVKLKNTDGTDQWLQGWQDLDKISIPNREDNPYITAFWEWFPNIYSTLQHFRITGGEPLLNKNTMKCLDYIIENPREDLELSINTNLSVPDKIWDSFLEKLIKLDNSSKFKKITIFTSFESWGNRAEYARVGIDFDKVLFRFEELLKLTGVRCVVMATYNLLSVTSFQSVLEWVLQMKKTYNFNHYRSEFYKKTDYDIRTNSAAENPNGHRVGIDIPYLRHPECLDVTYASDNLLQNFMIPSLSYMSENTISQPINRHLGFEPEETSKLERIIKNRGYFLKKGQDTTEQSPTFENRSKFYDFVNDMDIRNNTNFLKTFPEMNDFYELCKYNRNNIQG